MRVVVLEAQDRIGGRWVYFASNTIIIVYIHLKLCLCARVCARSGVCFDPRRCSDSLLSRRSLILYWFFLWLRLALPSSMDGFLPPFSPPSSPLL